MTCLRTPGLKLKDAAGWVRLLATAPLTTGTLNWAWSISPVLVAPILGLLSLTALVFVEQVKARSGRPVLLDLSLLRTRNLRYGVIAAPIVALSEFGVLFACLYSFNVRSATLPCKPDYSVSLWRSERS
jgi:hypothetical protein